MLAGLKLGGEAGLLEIRLTADVACLSPKSTGQASSVETLYCSLEAKFLLQEISAFVRLSTDWERPPTSQRIICFA